MLNDIRHGLRVLVQAKGWTVVVVVSLALGIGANTALFSGVHALLLKSLPVEDPRSLVRLRYSFERSNDMMMGTSRRRHPTNTRSGQVGPAGPADHKRDDSG